MCDFNKVKTNFTLPTWLHLTWSYKRYAYSALMSQKELAEAKYAYYYHPPVMLWGAWKYVGILFGVMSCPCVFIISLFWGEGWLWVAQVSFPHTLLVGTQTGTVTMKNSIGIPQKLRTELPYDPMISFLGIYLQKSENIYPQSYMYPYVHCSIYHGG